jgi:hypothetical protein
MKALNTYSCWIHRTVTSERHFAPSHPGFRFSGLQLQWLPNCKLLVVLWSGNENELYQLQVHIFSVIHLVHLFITKVWGYIATTIRGLSKQCISVQNSVKLCIFFIEKLTSVMYLLPYLG